MSIKTQKIIQFIPIINILTVFIWLNMCMKKGREKVSYYKNLIKMFVGVIVIAITRFISTLVIKNDIIDSILTYVFIYLFFLWISFVSVNAQQKVLESEQTEEGSVSENQVHKNDKE